MQTYCDLPDIFDFHGHRVRYATLGDGEPLVLLHGTPFSSVVWRRIAPQLAPRRRVYYFDMLGYGRSAKADPDRPGGASPVRLGADPGHPAARARLRRPAGYIHQAVLRAYIAGAVHRTLSEQEMRRYLAPWLGKAGQSAFYRQIAQMHDRYLDEVEPHYGAVRCPAS